MITHENEASLNDADQSKEKSGWISCQESLPDDEMEVIGWVDDPLYGESRHVYRDGEHWCCVVNGHRLHTEVSHWMHTPAAPAEAAIHQLVPHLLEEGEAI